MMEGQVIKSTGSWYRVLATNDQVYLCTIRGSIRLKELKSTNPIAVGDVVIFKLLKDENTGVIHEVLERENCIIRKATKSSKQTHLVATNIDALVLVVSVIQPKTPLGFIDRILVAAESYGIPSVLVFNKVDLYKEKEVKKLDLWTRLYSDLDYPSFSVSAINGTNLNELKKKIAGKKCLVSGLSGTGKSTLLNAMNPTLNLTTKPISNYHNKGVHTTTYAEMHKLADNTFAIDTPGMKEFGLIDIDNYEISHFFPEMKKILKNCKFHNCTHCNEPGCAVIAAVQNEEISKTRYTSYLGMVNSNED